MNRLFFVGATAVFLFACLFLTNNQTAAQTAVLTPTPDRLAAPPTVPAPTQADDGAQLYWLHCQPCHGDVGQGLSDAEDDDWRAQYPLDDQYCWNSGCHGARPYENGFTLPKQVPALIGKATLSRFESAADVYNFVRVAMPRQAPGHLADEEYLAIVAFLLEAHDAWDGRLLTAVSAQNILLRRPEDSLITTPLAQTVPISTMTAVPTEIPTTSAPTSTANGTLWLIVGGLLLLFFAGGTLWLKQHQ